MNLETAKQYILSHQNFVLAAHRSPDGDTLGSCLALRLALLAIGKEAHVVCPDAVPPYLSFLPGADTVSRILPANMEAVIFIDCGDHKRTGDLCPLLEAAPYGFCIDHHETNPKGTKNGDWVEPVAATAEMIYRLICALKVTVTPEIAKCIYTGIATDTGNFAYSNTTADTFLTASKLMKCNLDLPTLNRILFRTVSLEKAKLIAATLDQMELYENGAISLCCLAQSDFIQAGAIESDAEGLIDYLRDIDTVEVACLMRESQDGSIRGSFRSKTGLDVSGIAISLNGGGHARAAGFTLTCTLDQAKELVVPKLINAVRKWKESSQS